MQTTIIKVKNGKIPKKLFIKVIKALKDGEPVVFPTDTVYGIGARADNARGVRKIYRLKGRSFNKPLVWLIDSAQCVEELTGRVAGSARILMKRFWPGGITLIFRTPKQKKITGVFPGSLGLRVPGLALARDLIKNAGVPLATTSANISGSVSGTRSRQLKFFFGKVPFILDAGTLPLSKVSTVVDASVMPPHILREGAVSRKRIINALNL